MSKLLGYLGAVIMAVSLLAISPAQAHSGGIDWQGGHNCRVGSCAGTYHCHQARAGICARNSTPAPTNKRYANCRQARAAGVAPIYAGSKLYEKNRHLDRDRDGVACE